MPDRPDLLFLVHDLARNLRLDADRRARTYGMTRAQWVILMWLERQPGLSQKELAELVEVEPITIARLIDRLEQHGMVERRDDPHDRRIWRLHLRDKALPVLRDLAMERAEILQTVSAGISADDLNLINTALCRMKATVVAELRARPIERDVA